jgi:hypothetical protein
MPLFARLGRVEAQQVLVAEALGAHGREADGGGLRGRRARQRHPGRRRDGEAAAAQRARSVSHVRLLSRFDLEIDSRALSGGS